MYSININPLSSALQIKTLAGVGRDYLSGVHAALNIYTNIDKEKDTSFPIYLLYLSMAFCVVNMSVCFTMTRVIACVLKGCALIT